MRINKYKVELNEDMHNVMVKEGAVNYSAESKTFDNPELIVLMLNDCYRLNVRAEEYIYLLAFNCKNRLLGVFEISHGTVNSCIVSPREIFIRALLCGAANIILVHNHRRKGMLTY